MSLVVTRLFGAEIRIFSDTKLTSPEELLKGVNNSVLKAVTLRPDLCICFAGRIGPAQVALENLDRIIGKAVFDLEEVLEYLRQVHLETEHVTDFIIATLSPKPALYRIRNGKVERDLDMCWIGDQDAFSTYQRFFSEMPILDRDDVSPQMAEILNIILRMHMAFIKLVESGKHASVGEFMIEIGTNPGEGFYHEGIHIGHPGALALLQPIDDPEKIREWAAASGSYSFSILAPDKAGIGAIGIHFYEGNFGALFYPVKSKTTILVRDVDVDEFKKAVSDKFGVCLEGLPTNVSGQVKDGDTRAL